MPKKSKIDQMKFNFFMSSPGRSEVELRNRLLGKNTQQAARIIVEEFDRRFGFVPKESESLLGKIMPEGRATTWEELCQRIELFCKEFYTISEDNSSDIVWEDVYRLDIDYARPNYFERVLCVIESLPILTKWNISRKNKFETTFDVYRHFSECRMCWRSVPKLHTSRNFSLCSVHNLYSTTDEYRKKRRLEEKVARLVLELRSIVPTPVWVRQNINKDRSDYFADLCVDENGMLPNLARYLNCLGMPLDNHNNILRALEYPAYCKCENDMISAAWELYFENMGKIFWCNYMKLLRAEAWLRAEAECTRGRKRLK